MSIKRKIILIFALLTWNTAYSQKHKNTVKIDLIGPILHLSDAIPTLNVAYERKLKDNLSIQINTFYSKLHHKFTNPETRHNGLTKKEGIAIGRSKTVRSTLYIRPNLKWYFLKTVKGLYINSGVVAGLSKKESEFDGKVNVYHGSQTESTQSYGYYKGRELYVGGSIGLGYSLFIIKNRLSLDTNFTIVRTADIHLKEKSISDDLVVVNNELSKPGTEISLSLGYSF